MIYFVTAREIQRVKIGFSADPVSRFAKLRTDSPVALLLERVRDGDQADEARLHKRFASDRIAGEWFRLSRKIEAYMATLSAPTKRARRRCHKGHMIDDLGGNAVVARKLGVSSNAVSNWRRRGIPWKVRPALARLAADRAIALPADFWGKAA